MAKKESSKAFRIFQFQFYDTTHVYTSRKHEYSSDLERSIVYTNDIELYMLYRLFVLQKLDDGYQLALAHDVRVFYSVSTYRL